MLSPSSKASSVARLFIVVLIRIPIFSEGDGVGEGVGVSLPPSEEQAPIVNRVHKDRVMLLNFIIYYC